MYFRVRGLGFRFRVEGVDFRSFLKIYVSLALYKPSDTQPVLFRVEDVGVSMADPVFRVSGFRALGFGFRMFSAFTAISF